MHMKKGVSLGVIRRFNDRERENTVTVTLLLDNNNNNNNEKKKPEPAKMVSTNQPAIHG